MAKAVRLPLEDIKIEKNIPIFRGRRSKYKKIFSQMVSGDSVYFKDHKNSTSFATMMRNSGLKVTMRTIFDDNGETTGYRVWKH